MKKINLSIPYERSLKYKFPKIAKEWDYKNNNGLTPRDVSYGSKKKVFWICPVCKQSYPMQICNRTSKRKSKCSICRGLLIIPGINSLKAKYPNIVKTEWDFDKNLVDPDTIPPHRNKPLYWWKCNKCNRSYKASVNNKVSGNGGNCSYCSSQKLSKEKSLAFINPELAKSWHPLKNKDITPDKVFANSNNSYWWKCSVCGKEWEAKVNNRNQLGRGCPKCSKGTHTSFPEQVIFYYVKALFPDAKNGYKINNLEIDVYIPSLKIGIEYDGEHYHKTEYKLKKDYEKNNKLKELEITLIRIRENKCIEMNDNSCVIYTYKHTSNYKHFVAPLKRLIELLCEKAKIKNTLNIVLDDIKNQIFADLKIIPYEKSYEYYLKQKQKKGEFVSRIFDNIRNYPLKPSMVTPMSDKEVFWVCTKNSIHKGRAPVKSISKYGCDWCANRHHYTTNEWVDLAISIHGNKYDYSKVEYINSKTKVKIICKIHGEFEQIPSDHISGKGCKKCSGNYKDHEMFLKEIKEKFSNLEIIGKYKTSNEKLLIKCKTCGYEFEKSPTILLRSKGCVKCLKNDKQSPKANNV